MNSQLDDNAETVNLDDLTALLRDYLISGEPWLLTQFEREIRRCRDLYLKNQ